MRSILPQIDPFKHFNDWYCEAKADQSLDAEAMALATADAQARPAVRMVYFRGLSDDKQVKFYSNYNSRKGKELAINSHAALLFYWYSLNRQIRIEGKVMRMPPDQSSAYFASRPLPSQISSYLSQQSCKLKSYEEFEQEFAKRLEEIKSPLARPPHWGGYLLTPDRFEFYRGHQHRLNERLVYERNADGWEHYNISP